jgi:hypothetical protein
VGPARTRELNRTPLDSKFTDRPLDPGNATGGSLADAWGPALSPPTAPPRELSLRWEANGRGVIKRGSGVQALAASTLSPHHHTTAAAAHGYAARSPVRSPPPLSPVASRGRPESIARLTPLGFGPIAAASSSPRGFPRTRCRTGARRSRRRSSPSARRPRRGTSRSR